MHLTGPHLIVAIVYVLLVTWWAGKVTFANWKFKRELQPLRLLKRVMLAIEVAKEAIDHATQFIKPSDSNSCPTAQRFLQEANQILRAVQSKDLVDIASQKRGWEVDLNVLEDRAQIAKRQAETAIKFEQEYRITVQKEKVIQKQDRLGTGSITGG